MCNMNRDWKRSEVSVLLTPGLTVAHQRCVEEPGGGGEWRGGWADAGLPFDLRSKMRGIVGADSIFPT